MSANNNIEQIWRQSLTLLQADMSPTLFALNISPLMPLAFDNKTFTLGVKEKVFLAWIEANFKKQIEAALARVTGVEKIQVVFSVIQDNEFPAEAVAPVAAEKKASSVRTVAQVAAIPVNPLEKKLNRHFDFEHFVVGDCNRMVEAACKAVSVNPGDAYNPLFIHSNSGLGKTHLLNAIAWYLIRMNPNCQIECLTSEEFGNSYFDSIQHNSLAKFRNHFRNLDVLLIDDIQFFVGKEKFQEELFHTFNALFNSHKQIVIAADRPPRELSGLTDRLMSRFECGLTTCIEAPDQETRFAILLSKQEQQRVKFSNQVLQYIAERVKTNVRTLEGALFTLICSCTTNKVPYAAVTTDFVDEKLHDMFVEDQPLALTIEQIQKAVADFYRIKIADIMSHRRPANIAQPRQVAMFLSRKLTGLSLPVIADGFRKNHATVIHAISQVEKKYEMAPDFRKEIQLIEQALQA